MKRDPRSILPPIVWDLDGTLVHTRAANLRAYRSVGVEPPEDFHVRPWQEWCSPADHDRKSEVVVEVLLRHAAPTSLMALHERLGGSILTSASPAVIHALVQRFPRIRSSLVEGSHTPAEKVQWLSQREPGIYVDDSERTLAMVRARTRWRTLLCTC